MKNSQEYLKERAKLFNAMTDFMFNQKWDQERIYDTINNMATMNNKELQELLRVAKDVINYSNLSSELIK
jgi:hypothetical protein